MPNSPRITIACQEYDHTAALLAGTIPIDGADATLSSPPLLELFERMLREQAFDVAEMGLTYYLRTLNRADYPFVALPIFTMRQFAHRSIYLNAASGIQQPQALAGKTIGKFAIYGHDAGIMPKGILSDDYGFNPAQCRWLIGGVDEPMPAVNFLPSLHPADIYVAQLPVDRALGPMLADGEIAALIAAIPPKAITDSSSGLKPLFPTTKRLSRPIISIPVFFRSGTSWSRAGRCSPITRVSRRSSIRRLPPSKMLPGKSIGPVNPRNSGSPGTLSLWMSTSNSPPTTGGTMALPRIAMPSIRSCVTTLSRVFPASS